MKCPKTLIALLVAFTSFLIFSPKIQRAEAQAFKRVDENDPAPGFTLKDVDGNSFKLADYKGRVTALVFWKNPSLRCAAELAIVEDLYRKYNVTKGFEALAIYVPGTDENISGEELEQMKKVLVESEVTYPALIDKGMKVFDTYGVITFPSYAVVNEQGKVGVILPGLPTFGGEKLIRRNTERLLGIAEIVKVVKKKYQPKGKAAFYYNFAHKMNVKGFAKKALSKLEIVIKEDPEYYKPYRLQAIIYSKQKKQEKALAAYSKAVEVAPGMVGLKMEMAQYYITLGRFDESLKIYEKILEAEPESADAHYGLGLIYRKGNQDSEARQELVMAKDLFQKQVVKDEDMKLSPNRGNVHRELGDIYTKDGDLEQAYLEYSQACGEYERLVKVFLPKFK